MHEKNERYRHAVRGVWDDGHACYAGWPAERRALAQPGVDALLASLATIQHESDLIDRYLAFDARSSATLRPHLGERFSADATLVIEDECFWRRAAAIASGGRDA